ncbi:MAG: hypothetical protein WCI73_05495 [Phycisphaerae bacterium]
MIRRACWFVIPLTVILGACSKSTPPAQRVLLREARVTPGTGVNGLKLGMPVAEVLRQFGKASTSWSARGYHVDYPDLGVYALAAAGGGAAAPDPTQLAITEIACGTPDAGDGAPFWGRTTAEVGIGSTTTLVEKVYGAAAARDALTLNYPALGIRFAMQDDHVVRMIVFPAIHAATTAPAKEPS